MTEIMMNKNAKLSEHFTLEEFCKTSYHTPDGNIPSHKLSPCTFIYFTKSGKHLVVSENIRIFALNQ